MRLEVLMTILVLYQLIADLSDEEDKRTVINSTLIFFGIITVIGFVPVTGANLFGSMYIQDELRQLLKNILNVSTLIILLQSAGWLNKPENRSKTGSYLLMFPR
jgi:NADH:ubiquinone oxidoreductase subunit 2 (subunit N)